MKNVLMIYEVKAFNLEVVVLQLHFMFMAVSVGAHGMNVQVSVYNQVFLLFYSIKSLS